MNPIIEKITPNGTYSTPALFLGLEPTLLEELHAVPPSHPALPGFKTPIYVISESKPALADPRILCFASVSQFQSAFLTNPRLPLPNIAITVDSTLLPPGTGLDALLQPVRTVQSERCFQLLNQIKSVYVGVDQAVLQKRFESGHLKILGITSRFTTFLQHSMRDWLSGMRRLGHQTRLLIEEADHEILNSLSYAQACADFRPDLLLIIDHCRGEIHGLPDQIPSVMWIQDNLPNIFCTQAGQRQKRLDYTIGYGYRDCTRTYGYPATRFMPAMVGVNEQRFCPKTIAPSDREKFACDVAFVSHCSTPADVVLRFALDQQTNQRDRRVLEDVYQRIEAVYATGKVVVLQHHIRQHLRDACQALSIQLNNEDSIVNFFYQRIVNPLFRHQSLKWLAEMDVRLHLYGRGWETHPQLSRFAKGPADNQGDLAVIYQASKINLQVTPYGSAHQRMFEGLASGGFFLMRYGEGDLCNRVYQQLWQWCQRHHVHSDAEFLRVADDAIMTMYRQTVEIEGVDAIQNGWNLPELLRLMAAGEFTHSASTLWDEFDQVAFDSAAELRQRVTHFLSHDEERSRIAASMRQRVLDRLTYASTSRRLLQFISTDLSAGTLRAAG